MDYLETFNTYVFIFLIVFLGLLTIILICLIWFSKHPPYKKITKASVNPIITTENAYLKVS